MLRDYWYISTFMARRIVELAARKEWGQAHSSLPQRRVVHVRA